MREITRLVNSQPIPSIQGTYGAAVLPESVCISDTQNYAAKTRNDLLRNNSSVDDTRTTLHGTFNKKKSRQQIEIKLTGFNQSTSVLAVPAVKVEATPSSDAEFVSWK